MSAFEHPDQMPEEIARLREADEHARANHDRLMIILRGYFAQHAELRDDQGCPCRWCLEARAFLS